MSKVSLGFVPEPKLIPVEKVLPSRQPPAGLSSSRKYKQIQSSIAEVGLIEPLTVSQMAGTDGMFTLLDGHMRLLALRELGVAEVPCLEALDDESYTYNNRLNRLSSIQEHYMIRRALARGVAPERLAKALNIDVSHVRKKMNLLDGICPEACALLEDRQFSAELSRVIRKMKPTRQVECVELLVSANTMTVSYAEALLAATPPEMLVAGKKPGKLAGVSKGVHLISVQEVTVRTCPDREDWRGIYFDDARKCLSRLEFLLVSRAAAEGLFAWSNSAASTRFLCSL